MNWKERARLRQEAENPPVGTAPEPEAEQAAEPKAEKPAKAK